MNSLNEIKNISKAIKKAEHVEKQIKEVKYTRFFETTTICAIRLTNGYVVVGKSDCVDVADFNAETGEKYAYQDAIKKIFELLAYETLVNNPRV